ncbi:MAG: T9SS type A sorting domain-containing protein [Chitinophagales bacterium]
MKKVLQFFLLFLFLGLGTSSQISAQCSEGETEVILVLNSDTYGIEMYWEVELQGFVIASGGCEDIKPGGLRLQAGLQGCNNVYATGTFVESICIPTGLEATFTMYDDYGDGICCAFGNGSYQVLGAEPAIQGGEFANSMSHTFKAIGIEARTDVAMRSITTGNADYLVEGPTKISGSFENTGTTTVNSVTVNWQIDGGNVYKETIEGLNITPYTFEQIDFTHLTKWSALVGAHDLNVWVSKVNGFEDGDASNNMVAKVLNVEQQITENDVVVEHFTQASCGPCAVRNPAFDGMLEANRARVAPIKYHTSWPGVDPMYNHNPSEPSDRVDYYGVSGVPTAFLGGSTSAIISADDEADVLALSQEATQFVFDLEESMNDMGTGASINVKITSKGDIASTNLVAHVVVVEEMVEYDSPPGSNGELDFPQVMRKMFPGSGGTPLPSQTEGMVTDLNFTYDFPDFVDPAELRTIIFVQNNATRQVLQGYNSTGQTGTNVESNVKGGEVLGLGVTVAVADEGCPGGGDGSVTVGATQAADDTFVVIWEDDASIFDVTRTDLAPGVYTFTVSDAAGTQETYSVQVGIGEGPDVRFEAPEQFCIEDGKISFEIIGLEGGVFAIDGEAIEGNEWNPSKAGSFMVSYTFDNGQCANTLEKQIEVTDPIDAEWTTVSGTLEFCQNDFPVQFMANDDNGTWTSTGNGKVELTEEGIMFSAGIGSVPNDIFVVTYQGCGASVTKNITVYKQPSVTIVTTPSISICASDEETGIELKGIPAICGGCELTFNVYDENNNLVYEGENVNEDIFYPAKYIANDMVGESKFYAVSVNGNLCEGPSRELTVMTTAGPVVSFDDIVYIEMGESTVLDATNEGATYVWSTGATTPTIEVSEIGDYSVAITGADGCVANIDVTVDFVTSIEDLNQPTLSRAYPNPANQQMTIELVNITEDLQLEVRDLAGRLVMTQEVKSGTAQIEVKTNTLSEGTYLYQLSNGNTILSTQKIVVMH